MQCIKEGRLDEALQEVNEILKDQECDSMMADPLKEAQAYFIRG